LDIVSLQKDGIVKTYGWNELNDIPPIDCIIHLAGKAHDTKEHARLPRAGILRLLSFDTLRYSGNTRSVQVTQMGRPPRQFGRQAASGRDEHRFQT